MRKSLLRRSQANHLGSYNEKPINSNSYHDLHTEPDNEFTSSISYQNSSDSCSSKSSNLEPENDELEETPVDKNKVLIDLKQYSGNIT